MGGDACCGWEGEWLRISENGPQRVEADGLTHDVAFGWTSGGTVDGIRSWVPWSTPQAPGL